MGDSRARVLSQHNIQGYNLTHCHSISSVTTKGYARSRFHLPVDTEVVLLLLFQCDVTLKEHGKVRPNPNINFREIMEGVQQIETRLREVNPHFEVVWTLPVVRKFTREENVSRREIRKLVSDIRRLSDMLRDSGRCVFDLSINYRCGERRTSYHNRLIPDGIHQSPAGSTRLLNTLGRMLISKGVINSIMMRRGANFRVPSFIEERLDNSQGASTSRQNGPARNEDTINTQEDVRQREEDGVEVPQWMEDRLLNMY